ncbi:GAF domain-containing protein [Halobaculum limi]|uniref:GAF domain-containing protein n=1 Tax=Halobaculum limi TaxID=3031916 RepID=UPI0024063270|nr:GAF domain-containing protein [Halobaculum sp. YSMS11]
MTGDRVLQVDAQGPRRTTVASTLTGGTRFVVDPEPSGTTAADTLRHESYDAVLVGHPLPDGSEAFVEQLRGAYVDLPIVAYGETAALDAGTTRDLFRAGVTDLFVLDDGGGDASDDRNGLDGLVESLPEQIETFHERRRDRAAEAAFREVIGRVSASDTRMAGTLDDVLSAIRRAYDVDFAALTRVVDDEIGVVAADSHPDVPLAPDDVLPLAETYCNSTLQQNRTVAFGDVNEVAGGDDAVPDLSTTYVADVLGFECYLGTPIEVNGKPYGTLCVAGRSRRNGFANWEQTLIDLTAAWLGRELDHEQEKTDLRDAAFGT